MRYKAIEGLGAVSSNELHAFLTVRYRALVPERSPDVVAALNLDMRGTLERLVQEQQLRVCPDAAQGLSLLPESRSRNVMYDVGFGDSPDALLCS